MRNRSITCNSHQIKMKMKTGLRCEYHDYVNGRCTRCGKLCIRNAIAIIGENNENVQDVSNALLYMSARRRVCDKRVPSHSGNQYLMTLLERKESTASCVGKMGLMCLQEILV